MENNTVEIPAKFKTLVESIEKMSVLDLNELVKLLEKKFGVSVNLYWLDADATCLDVVALIRSADRTSELAPA